MVASDPLNEAGLRMQRAWVRDGLSEICIGVGLGFLVLLNWLQWQFERGSSMFHGLNWAVIAWIMVMPFGLRWIIPRLRNRWLGTRTGYSLPASPPRGYAPAWWARILAGAAGAVLVWLAFTGRMAQSALVLAAAALPTFVFWRLGAVLGVRRFLLLAVLSLAGGLAAALLTDRMHQAFQVLFGWLSLVLCFSGGLALRTFLKQNPASAGDAP